MNVTSLSEGFRENAECNPGHFYFIDISLTVYCSLSVRRVLPLHIKIYKRLNSEAVKDDEWWPVVKCVSTKQDIFGILSSVDDFEPSLSSMDVDCYWIYYRLTSSLKQCEFVWLHYKQIHHLFVCCIPDKVAARHMFAAALNLLLPPATTSVAKSTKDWNRRSTSLKRNHSNPLLVVHSFLRDTVQMYNVACGETHVHRNQDEIRYYLSMTTPSEKSLLPESGWTGPETKGRCWPVWRRTEWKSRVKLYYISS